MLTCRDCDRPFTFSDDERSSFAASGRTHAPSRCADCRVARKTRQVERGLGQMAPGFRELRDQQQTTTICGSCGGPAVVPFAVRRNRAVYCTDCFQRRRAAAE